MKLYALFLHSFNKPAAGGALDYIGSVEHATPVEICPLIHQAYKKFPELLNHRDHCCLTILNGETGEVHVAYVINWFKANDQDKKHSGIQLSATMLDIAPHEHPDGSMNPFSWMFDSDFRLTIPSLPLSEAETNYQYVLTDVDNK